VIGGIARLRHYTDATYIESVWVHRCYRRSGIASQLVRLLLTRDARRGAGSVFVWVIQPNPAAMRLYRSLGFEPAGERQSIGARERIEVRLRLRD
jgi:ribosomal protein S18 acetylase RimI-like enzyme